MPHQTVFLFFSGVFLEPGKNWDAKPKSFCIFVFLALTDKKRILFLRILNRSLPFFEWSTGSLGELVDVLILFQKTT